MNKGMQRTVFTIQKTFKIIRNTQALKGLQTDVSIKENKWKCLSGFLLKLCLSNKTSLVPK